MQCSVVACGGGEGGPMQLDFCRARSGFFDPPGPSSDAKPDGERGARLHLRTRTVPSVPSRPFSAPNAASRSGRMGAVGYSTKERFSFSWNHIGRRETPAPLSLANRQAPSPNNITDHRRLEPGSRYSYRIRNAVGCENERNAFTNPSMPNVQSLRLRVPS